MEGDASAGIAESAWRLAKPQRVQVAIEDSSTKPRARVDRNFATGAGPPIMATTCAIADAYQGQRRLGNIGIAASQCHILTDPAHPNVCDANHADDVTAQASWLS